MQFTKRFKDTVTGISATAVIECTPHQWANDWISYDSPALGPGVVNPLRVTLTPEEVALFRASQDELHLGSFWATYALGDDGRFSKPKREVDSRPHPAEDPTKGGYPW